LRPLKQTSAGVRAAHLTPRPSGQRELGERKADELLFRVERDFEASKALQTPL
jgi:hypothetical protein